MRVVRPDLAPDLTREIGERQQIGAGVVEVLSRGRELLLNRRDDPGELLPDGVGVRLVEHRAHERSDPRLGGLGHLREQIAQVMRAAPLPRRAGQRSPDRSDQAAVRIGDDQLHARQATGRQRSEEGEPARAVLVRAHVQAQHFAAAVGVHAHRDQGVDVHRPAVLADLDDQGVHPHERVVTAVEGPVAERLDLRVEVGRHLADLALGQLLDAELLDELLDPPR